jgi:hypothetical protein
VREIVNTSDERAVQAQQNEVQSNPASRSRRV